MTWFKKSQYDPVDLTIRILNSNLNGSVDVIRTQLESRVQNPCEVLSQICDGKNIPPFYMTVWSALCSPSLKPELEVDNNLNAQETSLETTI